jgi:hypothetical protein
MSRIALLAAVAFAALTGTAHAGGWATVELGAMPGSLEAGKPWRVELIVKQHGITPMADVTPGVEITNDAGVVLTFPSRPTKEVGHYVAEVTFPSAGQWKTRLYDGFTDAVPHRLSPLTVIAPGAAPAPPVQPRTDAPAPVVPAPAPPGADGFPWPQTIALAFVALLFLGGILATLGPLPRWHGSVTLRGRHA